MDAQFFQMHEAGVVRVFGEDSLTYLQSQLTINLRKMQTGSSRFGLRLNLRGRVCFGAQVIRTQEESFLMISRDTRAERMIELLSGNVVADEVEFEDQSDRWSLCCIHHPSSLSVLQERTQIQDWKNGKAHSFDQGWAYLDERSPAFTIGILSPKEAKGSSFSDLPIGDPNAWEKVRLNQRLFRIPGEIGEDEFPQEGELDGSAVDFDKGCYLGQEVMARIHAMGKTRRKAVVVRGNRTLSQTPVLPLSLSRNGKAVGSLKSMFADPASSDRWIGCAVVHESALTDLAGKGLESEQSDELVFLA